MLFKFFRKLLGIEENKYEPRILAGKYKPRIYNPDVYKVDDDFGLFDDDERRTSPRYSYLPGNIFCDD